MEECRYSRYCTYSQEGKCRLGIPETCEYRKEGALADQELDFWSTDLFKSRF